LNCIVCTRR